MTTQAEKAELLLSLHLPGDPLILTNVWDSVTARVVATARELGVSRVSFGPGILGLTLSHLREAVAVLASRGDYPAELGFEY